MFMKWNKGIKRGERKRWHNTENLQYMMTLIHINKMLWWNRSSFGFVCSING